MSEAASLAMPSSKAEPAYAVLWQAIRYSEDLDFVCGKAAFYFTDVEFKELIESALKRQEDGSIETQDRPADQIRFKKPPHPLLVQTGTNHGGRGRFIVPIAATPPLSPV